MNHKILIVDDEPMTLELFAMMLQASGYTVFKAEDGFKALKKVKEHCPDVILMDIMMPRMDGFEVCKRLRSEAATADLPVIMFSGTAQPNAARDGFFAGATRYLSKPISRQVLLSTIQEVLTK